MKEPPDCRLLLFAKHPRPGRVKTRLTGVMTPDEASRLYRAFLLDLVDLLARSFGVFFTIALADGDDLPEFRAMLTSERPAEEPVQVVSQVQGDLGHRLSESFRTHFREDERVEPLIILGADHPSIPLTYLNDACERLREQDVVVGPAEDGGFYAVGCRRFVPGMFDDLPWSTPELFECFRRRLMDEGTRFDVLEPWYDVDRPTDLDRLSREVAGKREYRRTAEVLEQVREKG